MAPSTTEQLTARRPAAHTIQPIKTAIQRLQRVPTDSGAKFANQVNNRYPKVVRTESAPAGVNRERRNGRLTEDSDE